MRQIKTNANAFIRFIFISFCTAGLVSCGTPSKEQPKAALSKAELEKITKPVSMPSLPSEIVIRSELNSG